MLPNSTDAAITTPGEMNADVEESTFRRELRSPLGASFERDSRTVGTLEQNGVSDERRTEKTTHSMMFMQCRPSGCPGT